MRMAALEEAGHLAAAEEAEALLEEAARMEEEMAQKLEGRFRARTRRLRLWESAG